MRFLQSIKELTAEVRALRTAAQTIALELHSQKVAEETKPFKVHYANEQPKMPIVDTVNSESQPRHNAREERQVVQRCVAGD